MAGKRLLDLAALFNASRGVAQKHVALRSRQLDVYNRTSTLARAIRSQTDRVTETAKAASFLISRLNETAPSWTAEATENEDVSTSAEQSIPSKESTEGIPASNPKTPLGQDHFYERSAENSAIDPPPKDDLKIQQEKNKHSPLPDGTVPPAAPGLNRTKTDFDATLKTPENEPVRQPFSEEENRPRSSDVSTLLGRTREPRSSQATRILQRQSEDQIPSRTADALDGSIRDSLEDGLDEDSFYRKSTHTSPSLSSLPRVKLPKHTSNTQGYGETTGQINSDTFYQTTKSTASSSIQTTLEQDELPEGVDTALFYSPRIAKLLGGKTHGTGKSSLKMEGAKNSVIDHPRFAEDKDQDKYDIRTSQKHPLDPSRFAQPSSIPKEYSRIPKEVLEEPVRATSIDIPEKV
jgi:aarF domain-containing kinase